MDGHVQQFVKFLGNNGIAPKSADKIIADDSVHRLSTVHDKRGKTSVSYRLAIVDECFSFGWARCHKSGITYNFSYRDSDKAKKRSAAELNLLRRKAAKKRKELEHEIEAGYKRVALKCSEDIKSMMTCANHEYLKRKRVEACRGLKIDGKRRLVVPGYDIKTGKISTYQTIDDDGNKLFVKGGRKSGSYFPITSGSDRKDFLIICEGLATGLTLYEASVDIPVLVAFDCHNLMHVAKGARDKYPGRKIIIAADNDQWRFNPRKKPDGVDSDAIDGNDPRWAEWRERGLLENIGRDKAEAAGASVGAYVIWPPIPCDDKSKRKDFNDWSDIEGIRKIIGGIINSGGDSGSVAILHDDDDSTWDVEVDTSNVSSPIEIAQDLMGGIKVKQFSVDGHVIPWYAKLIYTKKISGGDESNYMALARHRQKKSFHNLLVMLRECPKYAGIFARNEFNKRIYITRCPPWQSEMTGAFRVREFNDVDVSLLQAWMESWEFITPSKQDVERAIDVAADSYSFHPVREYLKRLKWDGKPRLGTWLKYYLNAISQPDEYLSRVGTMWMVAGVRRIMQPGCKFDHMLVLEGKTSFGKSTSLRMLATFGKSHEECFFIDDIHLSQIEQRDTILKLQGKLIVEIAELAGFERKNPGDLKKWITTQVDEVGVKFKQTTASHPRQFILAGSYNPEDHKGWLIDLTGNRRFLPVRVCKPVRFGDLERDKEQLWAEAVHLEANGYDIHMNPDEDAYRLAEVEHASRMVGDVWEERIIDIIDGRKEVTTGDVLFGLGMPTERWTSRDEARVARVMKLEGWKSKRIKRDGKWVYGWVRQVDDDRGDIAVDI